MDILNNIQMQTSQFIRDCKAYTNSEVSKIFQDKKPRKDQISTKERVIVPTQETPFKHFIWHPTSETERLLIKVILNDRAAQVKEHLKKLYQPFILEGKSFEDLLKEDEINDALIEKMLLLEKSPEKVAKALLGVETIIFSHPSREEFTEVSKEDIPSQEELKQAGLNCFTIPPELRHLLEKA